MPWVLPPDESRSQRLAVVCAGEGLKIGRREGVQLVYRERPTCKLISSSSKTPCPATRMMQIMVAQSCASTVRIYARAYRACMQHVHAHVRAEKESGSSACACV